MIFASDLDRTLIYSNSFLKPEIEDIIVVEKKDDQILSHMTNKSLELLDLINQKILFIPTTTRSMEQYKRISIFSGSIRPRYAIVSNGGIIIHDDEIDSNWHSIIKSRFEEIPNLQAVMKQCQTFLQGEYIKSCKCCDDMFIYAVLKDNRFNPCILEEMKDSCSSSGYTVTRNGRKIYIVPSFINKWEAIKHVMELENETKLIAAGDSLLDLDMLMNADFGIIPIHGELWELLGDTIPQNNSLHFTNQKGLLSCDELLQDILKLIS